MTAALSSIAFLAPLAAILLFCAVAIAIHEWRWRQIRRGMARLAEAPVPGRPRVGIDRTQHFVPNKRERRRGNGPLS